MIKIEVISYAKLGSKNFEFVIEFYVFNYFDQSISFLFIFRYFTCFLLLLYYA